MAIDFDTPSVKPPTQTQTPDGDIDVDAPPPTDAPWKPRQSALSESITDFAREGLDQPSRYDNEFVQGNLDLIRDRAEVTRADEMAFLDERMSQRGLVGSDIEERSATDLISRLDRNRLEQEYGVIRDSANVMAQDRSSAAGIAQAQVSRLQELGLAEKDLIQRAQKIGQTDTSLTLQERRDVAEQDYRLQALEQEAKLRGESFDIERSRLKIQSEQFDRDIDLRAKDIQNRSDLEGDRLTLAQSRLEAEKQWEEDRFGVAKRESLHRIDISGRDLELRTNQLENDYEVADRALLQDAAELDLRVEQHLHAAGIDTERLGHDAQRIQDASRLAGEEMTLREAMQKAELEARIELAKTNIEAEATAQGREITAASILQESTLFAEKQMQTARLNAQREMFDAEQETRNTEFLWRQKMERREWELDVDNAKEAFKDADQDRAMQISLQGQSEEWKAAQAILDRGTQMKLQEEMNSGRLSVAEYQADKEGAWRAARNTVDKDLGEAENALREKGVDDERAKWTAYHDVERNYRNADRKSAETRALVQAQTQQLAALLGFTSEVYSADARTAAILGVDEVPVSPQLFDSTVDGGVLAGLLTLLSNLRNKNTGIEGNPT